MAAFNRVVLGSIILGMLFLLHDRYLGLSREGTYAEQNPSPSQQASSDTSPPHPPHTPRPSQFPLPPGILNPGVTLSRVRAPSVRIVACMATSGTRPRYLLSSLGSLFATGYPKNQTVYVGLSRVTPRSGVEAGFQLLTHRAAALQHILSRSFPSRRVQVLVPSVDWLRHCGGDPGIAIKVNFWRLMQVEDPDTGEYVPVRAWDTRVKRWGLTGAIGPTYSGH